jgi:6-phosphogluconolactonase (cycloisomerase 2 family)
MRPISKLARAGALAIAASAILAGPALASPGHDGSGALFVQTDNPSGNTVVAYDRDGDGSLHAAGSYTTGGLGGVLAGSVVDHLASQGSLALDRERGLLYAVNAGSDTITVFSVHGDRLQRRQVLPSGGSFPVSVTVHGHLVYVLNARAGGSIQGYTLLGRHLIRVPAWQRALGLDPNATPEFTHTPGQVAFTPDGSQLLVTTKANTNAIDVFGVGRDGAPSAQPVVNVEPGTVPFGVDFDSRGRPVVAETGPNAVASFDLTADGTLNAIAQTPTGQAATCWIIRVGGHFYASNAGSASVSGFDEALAPLGNTPTDGGTVDAAASPDGRFLYVQAGAAGIVDAFRVQRDGSLTRIGSVTVPGAIGGEGIAAA